MFSPHVKHYLLMRLFYFFHFFFKLKSPTTVWVSNPEPFPPPTKCLSTFQIPNSPFTLYRPQKCHPPPTHRGHPSPHSFDTLPYALVLDRSIQLCTGWASQVKFSLVRFALSVPSTGEYALRHRGLTGVIMYRRSRPLVIFSGASSSGIHFPVVLF